MFIAYKFAFASI